MDDNEILVGRVYEALASGCQWRIASVAAGTAVCIGHRNGRDSQAASGLVEVASLQREFAHGKLRWLDDAPIKPSSLRVGMRVEYTRLDRDERVTATVTYIGKGCANVAVDGVTAPFFLDDGDDECARRAIRILDPAPAQSDRRVDASERDFADAAPAPFQSVALPQPGFTRNPEAAHLTRVAEGQAQQIDRLVAERDAVRMEVSLLRHQLEQARAIERENMQAKAVVARLVAENERLRGVKSTESLATESYEEP